MACSDIIRFSWVYKKRNSPISNNCIKSGVQNLDNLRKGCSKNQEFDVNSLNTDIILIKNTISSTGIVVLESLMFTTITSMVFGIKIYSAISITIQRQPSRLPRYIKIYNVSDTTSVWFSVHVEAPLQPSLSSQWHVFTRTLYVPRRSLHHRPLSGPTSPFTAHCRMYRTSHLPS